MKNKICIITSGALPVPDVKGGAIERLMTMLAEENEKYGLLDITILGVYDEQAVAVQQKFSKTKFVNLLPKECKYNIVRSWEGKIRWHVREHFGYDIHFRNTYPSLVDSYIKKEGHKFDLFVSEGYDYEALVTASKLYGKDKVCWHLHMNPPFNPRIDKIYGKCVAVSEYIINKYRLQTSNSKENTAVIFNGIDTAIFQQEVSKEERHQLRKSLGINDDDFVLVFCGRLVKVKGVKELIDAVLKCQNIKIKLLIIGSSNFGNGDEGSYPMEVKKLVHDHSDQIKFTGYIDNKDIYKYHKIADVGVIPSTYADPCPLSMFEMITSGLPTIATAAGGMTEIGNADCTIFVHLDNIVDELSRAINTLANNPQKSLDMHVAALKRSDVFAKDRFYNDFCKTINVFINENL